MSNPLVADEPRSGLFAGGTNLNSAHAADGAGLFYDGYALTSDLSDGNWVGAGVDVAGTALDTLSFVEDPLQGLLSAGIGWLIEHVSFLSEPLDYLAGNADLVQEKSQTWKNIKQALEQASADYTQSAQALLQQYTGTAASAYATSAQNFAGQVKAAAAHADNAATSITVAAAIVGTTRGLVRDWISTFVAQAIEKWAIAAVTSFLDFGASMAAFIADEVVEGSILAEKTGSKLTEIAEKLGQMASKASSDASKLAKAAQSIDKDAAKLSKSAQRTLKDTSADVKTASTTAKKAFQDAEKTGFTGGTAKQVLSQNRALSHGLEKELEDVSSIKSAAETAAQNTGRASTALGDTARQAGKVQRSIESELDKLTEQRRDIVGTRIAGKEHTEQTHLSAGERVRKAAVGSTVDGAKHIPVEGTRQGYTERHNREEEQQNKADERTEHDGELQDGSLLSD